MYHSILELFSLASKNWVPNWFDLFSDNENGGFHERLGPDGQPLDMPKRLLTQCRQLLVYSQEDEAYTGEAQSPYRAKIDEAFQFIKDKYHNPKTGGSIFSINKDGSVADPKYDLYGHAFILLGSAAYYKATENRDALELAKTTFNFVKDKFKLPNHPGYAEALDDDLNPIPEMRRQNPHMHMMEACIYMYEASGDQDYLDMAGEMLELFFDKLLDKESQTLGEFFADDLSVHQTEGHKVEAGHHAEWVWLLKRYQEVSGSQVPRIEATMDSLFTWVKTHGIDPEYGGVFNEQDREGKIINESKRIWPNLETVRAAAIMTSSDQHRDDANRIIEETTGLLREHYIDANTGVWNEYLNRELEPTTDYRPGTTPYHIVPVLRETVGYLPK